MLGLLTQFVRGGEEEEKGPPPAAPSFASPSAVIPSFLLPPSFLTHDKSARAAAVVASLPPLPSVSAVRPGFLFLAIF